MEKIKSRKTRGVRNWKSGKEFNWGREVRVIFSDPIPSTGSPGGYNAWHCRGLLVLMLLLVCWLLAGSRSMQSHANSRQAGSSCIACLGLAQRRPGQARPHSARPVHWCASHAVTLLLREEKERDNGQTAGPDGMTLWRWSEHMHRKLTRLISGLLKRSIMLISDHSICELKTMIM